MLEAFSLTLAVRQLKKVGKDWPVPFGIRLAESKNPFWVLVGAILSLRTRDPVAESAFNKLMKLGQDAENLAKLEESQLKEAIYPVAFFKEKANNLKGLSQTLIKQYQGKPPKKMEELLSLRGVGRKTANMVLTLGYDMPGICVDVHVHRIVNRWGYIKTKNPDETEEALRKKLPKRYWKDWNRLLVTFGQNCCKPTSPYCESCCLKEFCPKVGVGKFR
jgi:endonuclease III